MYADRLGERWHGMNPVGSMARAGVEMAFGSDSPVTPVNPWLGIRAAINHREPEQRIDPATAFSVAHPGRLARSADRRRRHAHARSRRTPGRVGLPRRSRGRPSCSRPRPAAADAAAPVRRRRRRGGGALGAPKQQRVPFASTRPRSAAPARWRERSASRSSRSPTSTPRSRSSGRRCGWPVSPAPTPTAPRGSTALRTPYAPTSVSSTGWRYRSGMRCCASESEDLLTLAQKASAGSVRFRVPEGRDATRARSASRKRVGGGIRLMDKSRRERERMIAADRRRPAEAVDLPHRRDRRHLRGHPAGPGRGPRGRRHHRSDPLDGSVAAGLRSRGRHP